MAVLIIMAHDDDESGQPEIADMSSRGKWSI